MTGLLGAGRLPWIFALLFVLVAAMAGDAQIQKPLLPVPPAELLKYLPSAPPNWTVTESGAKNLFVSWLCAQATREFHHPSSMRAAPGDPPPPPFITRVRLMDTGYFPSFNGDFENFRVGKYSNAESLLTFGMPSRRITISPTRERLRISVRGRFIVEIETDNQPADSGKAWLQFIDFRNIAAIPDTGGSELPKPIIIQVVDELHPTNNSSSKLYWGGPKNAQETER